VRRQQETLTLAADMKETAADGEDATGAYCAAEMVEQSADVAILGRITLAWQESSASEVRVCGSWDGWARQLQLVSLPTGFGLALALPPGCYQCRFIVDGVWKSSTKMPSSGPDGNNDFEVEGNLLAPMRPEDVKEMLALCAAMVDANAGVAVVGGVTLEWQGSKASRVRVCGSWDGWTRQLHLAPTPTGFWVALALPPGCYQCKFIVDDVWNSSAKMPTSGRDGNNYFEVEGILLAPMLLEQM